MIIRVAGMKRESLVDGPGICFVIFTQGCLNDCPGCHNPDARPLKGGMEVTIDGIYSEIKSSKGIDSVVFSGGEPFLQAAPLSSLGEKIRRDGLRIIAYSGYTFEQLLQESRSNEAYRKLLEVTDILIDGPYIEEKKDLNLAFRGSRNQRIIDVKLSQERKAAVIMEEFS